MNSFLKERKTQQDYCMLTCSVVPYTRDALQSGYSVWNFPVKVIHNFLSASMQHLGPAVVAKAGPQCIYFLQKVKMKQC